MQERKPASSQDSEVIALKALVFLATDAERLDRFLGLTGLTYDVIRRQAADPAFLAGVLDHLLSDQTLLFLFAESEGLAPAQVERARGRLPGSRHDL